MMYGFGTNGGWWVLGMGMMVVFLAAIILLVIWGVRVLDKRRGRPI